MAGEIAASHRRDPIKNTVGNAAVQRRRQHAVSVAKERREAMFRTKRLCTEGFTNDMDVAINGDMMIEEESSLLEAQTSSAVEELKLAISSKGKENTVNALRELRRLLSRSEFPFVEIALKSGAIPLLAQCLSFGSQDEQLLEAAWCLTNIAAGKPEETKKGAIKKLFFDMDEKEKCPTTFIEGMITRVEVNNENSKEAKKEVIAHLKWWIAIRKELTKVFHMI